MVKVLALATLAAATMAVAAPTSKQVEKRAADGQADIDTVILNYALTLEHLERAFYRDHLPSQSAFLNAGYRTSVRNRFIEIGGHEKTHVDFLEKALGDKAVKECKYEFGITGPDSFVATAQLLEGVGVSAYLGAAANITNPAYLQAAGSILTTESRHSAWVQSYAGMGGDPAGSPFDTPLNFNQTFSLAAPLIKSCPDSNAELPVKAFPAASFKSNPKKLGSTVTLVSKAAKDSDKVAFIGGNGATVFAPIKSGNQVTLPDGVTWGRTYAVVVKGNAKSVTDENTVAGPIPFDILPSSAKAAAFYS